MLLLINMCCIANSGWSQPEDYNHPELRWFSIETEHFHVHFHNGAERTAKVVAKIAEEIYGPITSLYDYQPGSKYHFIIRDHDDYSNGAAFFYDNKIEIWATAVDFELRGTHNWLRNVVTHEFTHMISLQASMKISQRIPAFYFQAIGYEDERRPDVLRGGPNAIVSYPISMMVSPAWFAEGIAQFMVPGLGYDTWDTHRDMILRVSTLDNRLLSYDEMGVFGKNSLGNEKVYNHGYGFVSYLVDKYGLETIHKTTEEMRGFFRFTLEGALEKATGKSGKELYKDWTATLESRYRYQTSEIRQNLVEGVIVKPDGIGNFYPQWSPDGQVAAYLTNAGNDYMSQTRLVIINRELAVESLRQTDETWAVQAGVAYPFSWSPDGNRLAYSNKSAKSKGGSHFYDLYIYDLNEKKTRRMTKAQRAHSPHWSPDGGKLVFVYGRDSSENLGIFDIESGQIEHLTEFKDGEQLYKPQWSPDGMSIMFGISRDNGRNIYTIKLHDHKVKALLEDNSDARDAVFHPDGKSVYFSWDKTGIFNIYSLDLESGEVTQWTNVLGGAFMPSVNTAGELLFSLFTSDGYKLAYLKSPEPLNELSAKYLSYKDNIKLASTENLIPATSIEPISVKNSDDSQIPNFDVTRYKSQYSPLAILPRILVDYGTLKAGAYLYSSDVLDKYGFLLGFDINRFGDYDLFAQLEFRMLGPTLFLEGYNQVQNTSVPVDSIELIRRGIFEETEDKFRYNLLEVDAGAKFKLNDNLELRGAFVFSRYGARAQFQESTGESSFGYTYYLGRDFSFRLTYSSYRAYVHSDINPMGRYISFGYDLNFDEFLEGFVVDNRFVDGIGEVFKPYNYNRFTLHWRENLGLPIKNHTFNIDFRGGFVDAKVDSFFNFFGGGMLGNRGYPYFSIEGSRLLMSRVTYRFPIASHLDLRLLHLYFDKIFFGVFFDYGNAFVSDRLDISDFKSSLGFQVRVNTFSFYSFPADFFFDAAYGLNRFENGFQTYGKEWRFYFGLTFGYLD